MFDIQNATLEELFDEMARLKVNYRVTTLSTYGSTHDVWVKLEGKFNGLEISCEETTNVARPGVKISDTIRRVFDRWCRAINYGEPALLKPPVEAVALPPSGAELTGDEIQF